MGSKILRISLSINEIMFVSYIYIVLLYVFFLPRLYEVFKNDKITTMDWLK